MGPSSLSWLTSSSSSLLWSVSNLGVRGGGGGGGSGIDSDSDSDSDFLSWSDWLSQYRSYRSTLSALVDAVIPPSSTIPDMDSTMSNPLSQAMNPARFWTFRISHDPGFWNCLEQRLQQQQQSQNNHHTVRSLLQGMTTGTAPNLSAPFTELSLEQQEAWLESILMIDNNNHNNNNNSNSQQQQLMMSKNALGYLYRCIAQTAFSYHPAMSTHTTAVVLSHGNPFWSTMGYPGTAAASLGRIRDAHAIVTARRNHLLQPLVLPARTNETECDVVIVGSGVAGSVAAALLSRAGYHVIVIEQGPRPTNHDHLDTEQAVDLKWKQIQETTSSSVQIITARVVGGSAMYHSGACHILPQHIQQTWVEHYGLHDFAKDGPYETSLRAVSNKLNTLPVKHLQNKHNAVNHKLRQACIQFGIPWTCVAQTIHARKDIDSTDTAGFVAIGCDRYRQRTTPSLLLLQEAAQSRNCHLLDQTTVTRILLDANDHHHHQQQQQQQQQQQRATGVIVSTRTNNHTSKSYEIRARRAVIVTAGALETPRLLHRSGIHHEHLGQNLKLQPSAAVLGFADSNNAKPILAYQGLAQSIMAIPLPNSLNNSHAILQATTLHPGWMARQLASTTTLPKTLKSKMRQFRHCVPFVCTIGDDHSSGSVVLHNNNNEGNGGGIHYTLSALDQAVLRQALLTATRMQWATGAQQVSTTTLAVHNHHHDGSLQQQRQQSLAEYLEQSLIVPYPLISTSPMGTCRMTSGNGGGVVDSHSGQVCNVNQLHIMDASCFPTCTVVDPMITILACAHLWTTKLLKSWKNNNDKDNDDSSKTTTTRTTTEEQPPPPPPAIIPKEPTEAEPESARTTTADTVANTKTAATSSSTADIIPGATAAAITSTDIATTTATTATTQLQKLIRALPWMVGSVALIAFFVLGVWWETIIRMASE